jgi:hypothetical protein
MKTQFTSMNAKKVIEDDFMVKYRSEIPVILDNSLQEQDDVQSDITDINDQDRMLGSATTFLDRLTLFMT